MTRYIEQLDHERHPRVKDIIVEGVAQVAGTFGINDQAVWMPNSTVLRRCPRIHCRASRSCADPALAEQLRDAQLDRGQAIYLDDLDGDRFKTFEAATVAAFEPGQLL